MNTRVVLDMVERSSRTSNRSCKRSLETIRLILLPNEVVTPFNVNVSSSFLIGPDHTNRFGTIGSSSEKFQTVMAAKYGMSCSSYEITDLKYFRAKLSKVSLA